MIRTIFSAIFIQPGCRTALLTHRSGFLACLCLAASLLASTAAWAGKLSTDSDMTSSLSISLQQWAEPPDSAPYLLERLDQHSLDSIADEASKQAQAEYLAKKFRKSLTVMRNYVDLAWNEAQASDGLTPELLIAIMQKESSLRPKIQSRYGAQGLMQVVRRWHRDKLHPSESLFDPQVNVRVGTDVLQEYLDAANGNLNKALRKYSGNTPGYAGKVLKASRELAHIAAIAVAQADEEQDGVVGKG